MNRISSWIYKLLRGSKRRYKKDVKLLNKQLKEEKENPTTDTSFKMQTTGTTDLTWYEQEDEKKNE